MFITYLNIYLIFLIFASLILGIVVLKTRVAAILIFLLSLFLLILFPAFLGYFYFIHFNPLSEIVVPDLTGLPFDLAKERFEVLGLPVRIAGSISETNLPAGYVVSQRPEVNRKVKVGRTVALILSAKEEKTEENTWEEESLP